MTLRALVYVCAAWPLLAASGCLGPNPLIDAGEEIGSETSDLDTTEASSSSDTDTSTSESETATETETDTGPASCTDSEQNGNETAIDCGGDCPACEDGETCEQASDCLSGVCELTCQAATCNDGVRNGDELEIDCGGVCNFCELSAFIGQWDDVDGKNAGRPRVVMFETGEIAISFHAVSEARVRWFQELGAPLTASAPVGAGITFVGSQAIPLAIRADLDDPSLLALVAGEDAMSTSSDLFLVERDLDAEGPIRTVFQGPAIVRYGDVAGSGSQAIMAWQQDKQIYLRRRDFSVGEGMWVDVMPLPAETSPQMFDGNAPDLAVGPDGTIVLAWSRCAKAGTPCSIALRRFDTDWIESEPVQITPDDLVYYTDPHVSVSPDGRIGLAWNTVDIDDSDVYAQILEPDLSSMGTSWILQANFLVQVSSDVVALADGSFAYAWADPPGQRVHLRRYVGNDMPKLPGIGDEAPWPQTPSPAAPSLAAADNRLVVVWETAGGGFTQIAGQVLAY